jgi:ABC-2 type transport system ATP-binding protein
MSVPHLSALPVPGPGREPAIVTRGLTRRYGSVVALDHLDLEVPTGSVFGFLGPNGAGKTTTLRLLAGLGRATSGTAVVAGVPVGQNRPELARRIGYLDQDPKLYAWMRGREVLELAGRLYGLSGVELRQRVRELLEQVGLLDAAERRVAGYSGGMRQRLGIAQAIIHRPPVVFLDEPVSALDPEGRHDVLGLIEQLRPDTTVFMSTHILGDVERICDRVAILDAGHVVVEGTISELLDQFARPSYELELEPGQPAMVSRLADALRAHAWAGSVETSGTLVQLGVRDPEAASSGVLAVAASTGARLIRLERRRPTLEDVFLQLVGREHRQMEGAA